MAERCINPRCDGAEVMSTVATSAWDAGSRSQWPSVVQLPQYSNCSVSISCGSVNSMDPIVIHINLYLEAKLCMAGRLSPMSHPWHIMPPDSRSLSVT